MKSKFKRLGRRTMAMTLAASMMASGAMIAAPVEVAAAGTPVSRDDNSIIYAVDCGDINPTTAPEDGPLGTHNSVTDQIYGEDPETGYLWGIDDTVSNPLKNGAGASPVGVSTDWTWAFEQAGTVDCSSKTLTNRYTKNQFEKDIETRHIDYKFEVENGTYFVEVGFTDPWGCSKTPSVYANYGQEDETVIQENFNVASNGGIATGTVEVTDGDLTINARGTGSSNLAINMTYITIRLGGDEALAQTDYDALSIKTKDVTADLELITTGSKAGSNITWETSDADIITNDGKVTRPASGEDDATVTLTATIVNGEATLTKTFEVTVKAMNSAMGMNYFDRTAVEVTDEYYDNALDLDVENLLELDADRLLAGFRETACYAAGMTDTAEIEEFMKNKTRYGGGWENSLIGGHTLGHYMTAVAQGIVNPGVSAEDKEALTQRLNYLVDSLAECQEMTVDTEYEGYLFGATLPNNNFKNDVDLQFDNVEVNKANIGSEAWVPWYTMHKILAGLTDAYEVAGNEKALTVANKLATWISDRANGWSNNTQQTVLGIEYGGMNDALYQLYKVTDAENKEDFKAAAHQFDETALFENVLNDTKNALNGKHANTTIPKFLGALCRYEVDNTQTKYLQYAEAFWDMVNEDHTYITGGNSENEHFGADCILNAERTFCNNETCNTYNMLKLSRRLFVITGEKKYADYYETTLINAIMSSQNPETGMTMYFQPMATGYHKVFGTLDTNFWCCTGSGMENFTKLQDSIYYKKDGVVLVNLYIASRVTEEGYTIEQTGDLSKSDTMTFNVSGDAIDFDLRLRTPDWVKDGNATVKVNDEVYDYNTRDGYIIIKNEDIVDGATVTIKLPMEVKAYNLPDGEDTYAFKYGPFVLSAKLGTSKQTTGSHGVAVTVPTTKAVSSDTIGIRTADTVEEYMENINENLVKENGAMNFTLAGTNFDYVFTTHFNQYRESYGIYWTYYIDEDGRGSEAVLAEKEANRVAETTIDSVAQIGRGQYESRFLLPDGSTKDGLLDNDSVGVDAPDLTRCANAGGSFGYKMIVSEDEDNYLLVTYAKEDDGKPIKITVGDTVITDEVLDSENAEVTNINLATADQADYYQVLYKISADVIEDNVSDLEILEGEDEKTIRVITVTFAGTDEEASARVCKSLGLMRAYRTENSLSEVEFNEEEVTAVDGTYTITTPYNVDPAVKFSIADEAGYVEIDGNVIDEKEAKTLKPTGAETTFTVKVYAQDFKTTTEYKVVVKRDYSTMNLKEDLVASFTFDDKTDGAYAVSRAFSPAKVSNAKYKYEAGIHGKAITMSGSYGLKLLDDTSALADGYTITYWMNSKVVGNTYNPTLAAGTFSPEYWLNLTTDGKLWSSNGAWVSAEATGAYTANTWHHVAVVVDESVEGSVPNTVNGKLYVDGKLVSDGNVAKGIMAKSGSKLYFGVNAWDAYFTGAVDDVLVFNRALASSEVQGISSKVTNANGINGVTGDDEDDGNDGDDGDAGDNGNNGNDGDGGNDGNGGNTGDNGSAGDSGNTGNSGNAGNAGTTGNVGNAGNSGNEGTPEVKATSVVVKAAGYTLKGNKIILAKGKKVTLVTSVLPADADQSVSYTSSKKNIAKVSAAGVVQAKKTGTAKITIAAKSGTKKVVTIKVVKKEKLNKKLTLKKAKLSMKKGKTATITVKKMTSGTTSKLTYKSSKKSVATVDKYGVIKAKKKGKAVITVKCGKATKKVNVTVK